MSATPGLMAYGTVTTRGIGRSAAKFLASYILETEKVSELVEDEKKVQRVDGDRGLLTC
jgi:RecA/RadA recombinase